ncbi:MAG TPA: hypothetical protein VFC38_04700 [Stellaceae bacterium]|nr:hypothetical protein [Stellaceae bacterium]
MTDLEEYRRFVATMAAGDKPSETFSNFSHEHAAVVIAAIFRHARNHVEILTGALDPDVYCTQEVIDAAVAFARQPGASIRVLPERPIAPNHALLAALAAANLRNRIIIYDLIQRSSNELFHFVVADGRHYRFEQNREEMTAIIQFGEPKLCTGLHEYFDKHAKNAVLQTA